MPEFKDEQYLGDGLYASYDGWFVYLRAPRPEGDHWVGLEPPILDAFLRYLVKSTAAKEYGNA